MRFADYGEQYRLTPNVSRDAKLNGLVMLIPPDASEKLDAPSVRQLQRTLCSRRADFEVGGVLTAELAKGDDDSPAELELKLIGAGVLGHTYALDTAPDQAVLCGQVDEWVLPVLRRVVGQRGKGR